MAGKTCPHFRLTNLPDVELLGVRSLVERAEAE
jgi:hypothetical protein